jgi:hypothetical protein
MDVRALMNMWRGVTSLKSMSNQQSFVEDFIYFYSNVKGGCYTDVVTQIELEKLYDKACKLNDKPFEEVYDPYTDRVLSLRKKVTLDTIKKLGQTIRKNKRR